MNNTYHKSYTSDVSLTVGRKRQSSIDIVRLLRDLRSRLECGETGFSQEQITDFDNCQYDFIDSLPKTDQAELREG